MSAINFQPWVGKDYQQGGIFGKKILVLGESHYCEDELKENGRCYPSCERAKMLARCHSQTIDVIEELLNDYKGLSYQKTFVCFERAVMGKELSLSERAQFWNSVVFYNYMQYAQSGPVRPLEQKNDSSEAFKEILEKFSPDYIIVWGQRLYSNMPDWGGEESFISINDQDINGKKIPAMSVYHPSTPSGKNWEYWHEYYKIFLNL